MDLALVVRDDRVAVRRLVAGEPECVQRERVLVGRRPLLLEQAAEHAELDRRRRPSVERVRPLPTTGAGESAWTARRVDVTCRSRDSYVVAERPARGRVSRRVGPDGRRAPAACVRGARRHDVRRPHPPRGCARAVRAAARRPGRRRVAHPIVDLGTTTVPHMARILDDVDAALEDVAPSTSTAGAGSAGPGRSSGAGSSGTGLTTATRSQRIARLRRDLARRLGASPQTAAQRAMVTEWKPGR